MKKFFLFIVLMTSLTYSQWSTPAGYTSFLKLRYYSLDAQPGPDSIRQNLVDIDNFAKLINDTTLALLSRANAIIDYNSTIKNGVIEYDDFNTALKNKLVTKDLTETVTGSKTFTSTTYATNIYPTLDLTHNLGAPSAYWRRGYFGWLYANYLIMPNPSIPNDTAIAIYDGTNIVWNKPFHLTEGVNITGSISADSLKFNSSIRYIGLTLNVSRSDSISIVLSNFPLFYFNPSENTEIKFLDYFNPTASGTVVILLNPTASYTVTLKDGAVGGNLRLAGDFTMGQDDVITLMRVYKGFNSYEWVELYRSNN